MIPNKRIALQELEIAGELNPGQWTEHSKNVALAILIWSRTPG